MKRLLFTLLILLIASSSWSADAWRDSSTSWLDGDATEINDLDTEIDEHLIDPVQRYFLDPHKRMVLSYASASALTVQAGSIICENAAGTLVEMRRNTSSTSVGWGDLDTGSESNTTYHVFANCDADATTATFVVSTNYTKPSTATTLYKVIGSFVNTGGDIVKSSIAVPAYYPLISDSTGKNIISAIYSYVDSASSYTAVTSGLKIAFGISTNVAGGGSETITNLPFTSSSTYTVVMSRYTAGGSTYTYDPSVVKSSGSAFIRYNNWVDAIGSNGDAHWLAIGY